MVTFFSFLSTEKTPVCLEPHFVHWYFHLNRGFVHIFSYICVPKVRTVNSLVNLRTCSLNIHAYLDPNTAMTSLWSSGQTSAVSRAREEACVNAVNLQYCSDILDIIQNWWKISNCDNFVPLYRFRNTRHRYFVHANLALSLGLAETLFVIGVTKTANQVFMSMQLWLGLKNDPASTSTQISSLK